MRRFPGVVIANIRAEAAIISFFSAVRVAMCLSLVMIAIPALDTAGIHSSSCMAGSEIMHDGSRQLFLCRTPLSPG